MTKEPDESWMVTDKKGFYMGECSTKKQAIELQIIIESYDQLKETCERYKRALNVIASWKEGTTVNSSFDEPNSAEIARKALSETPGGKDDSF